VEVFALAGDPVELALGAFAHVVLTGPLGLETNRQFAGSFQIWSIILGGVAIAGLSSWLDRRRDLVRRRLCRSLGFR
jgi:hypothetical protein